MQVLRDEGVVAPQSFHTAVHLNGKFYGLFGIIEEVRAVMTAVITLVFTSLWSHHDAHHTCVYILSVSDAFVLVHSTVQCAAVPLSVHSAVPHAPYHVNIWQQLASVLGWLLYSTLRPFS
jgi:ATP/ADP translocase